MCNPALIIAAVAVVGSVAANVDANHAAKRQARALTEQNQIRADEIADQKGVQLTEEMRAARRERAAMRLAAAESGINLGSGSFLAMLQTSEVNQSMNSGLILKDAENAQRGRQAEYKSMMAGITRKTGLGIALDAASAGVSAYYGAGGKSYLGNNPGRG